MPRRYNRKHPLQQHVIDNESGPVSLSEYNSGRHFRNALLAACDRVQAREDFCKQHGPVKVIMRDGKLVE